MTRLDTKQHRVLAILAEASEPLPGLTIEKLSGVTGVYGVLALLEENGCVRKKYKIDNLFGIPRHYYEITRGGLRSREYMAA